ncbi:MULTISPECIES: adenylate/guanylate cyclase domain-containing protein [unclassified Bradyrhizobium]|uniref:adenylate/guanylate cyclase domain-containing protein n=1 Tax=unclassified Bradyrhizobium TaxID=2631580 RepID=UPI001FFA9864|nr:MULTISPECIES: adenylate/guanylate cyclase domain-containing protein [unclassified Bradyrhizobium]MCK1711881.1 adenylate/guanylate cyclase domain-containing protein [Bradyrhizobium sp. 143]MCK1728924.1 adenylate/guanylate cyclase domain-containing protein [Bradyrhizobium sp. 142]
MSETRKIAAILAADVVGYSLLAGADEDRTLARLRALRSDLVDPTIAVHHGRIVKRTGDGALVEFRSVVDAVRCAIEVQNGMVERNAGLAPERRIEFRIGIHLGDIVEESDGDLMGDGVNIAARLEGIAKPGAICLSEDAYRQVKARLDLVVSDLGETNLKNIAEPIRVYSLEVDVVARASLATQGEPAPQDKPTAPPALPNKPSIAVLPFQNMSGDPEQEYFADGIVEDITTGLSRIKWLFVIARNSSFTYKGKMVDIKQVGRDLGVRYVLEGGIRKAGNRVRITGQLIEAETGAHLWAERYDRPLDDIFAVQDEITLSVVGVIEPSLRRAEIERVKRKRPDNLDAYDLVLQALPFAYTGELENATTAIPLLERAVALDPGYAGAQAALAWCFHHRFSRGGLRDEDSTAAIRHARAAATHGGDDATALAMAGLVIAFDERDHATALNLFNRALSISSSNIFALSCSALVLAYMGTIDLAIERAQLALRLSPFDPMNFMPNNALAIANFHARQYEVAADAARRAIEVNPRFSACYAHLAAALIRLGRDEEAKAAAQRVLDCNPKFSVHGWSAAIGTAAPSVLAPYAEALREAGLPK